MKIAAFPKCYLEDIARNRTMTIFEWIAEARQLSVDGLEMYEGFLESVDDAYVDQVTEAIHKAGFAMPMMCCSPDLTNPDADARKRAIEHEARMIQVTSRMGGEVCRVLTGQRYPDVSVEQGLEWVVDAIHELIAVAREYGVILGLENHYKDGHWQYPEFAQKKNVFLQVLAALPERKHFGVQYDPSNALVAGENPLELLDLVADRVVSMHASDRHLVAGKSLEDMRQSDGTLGYSPYLVHGVIGQGLNDYDSIFSKLRAVNYRGWVSVEDGINGVHEIQQSVQFLQHMRETYFRD